MSAQVLIAGAGPTGLTLGIDLARRGIAVRVVDRAETFFEGSRGDGLQPRTLEVFEDLGVLDAVFAQGCGQATLRVHLGGEFLMERRMTETRAATPEVPYPNPWVLGQSDTERVLRNRLAEFGVKVESGTAVTDFSADEHGVTVSLEHGGAAETVRVAYLVGADGGRSTVRRKLGIAFAGTTDESIRMLLGDVRADALDHDYGYWFAEPDSPMDGFAMSPLPGGRKFQFAAPLAGDSDASLEVLQQHVNRLSRRTDIVLSELSWATVWRPNIRLAERFRDGRVFLAGDAAHAHPPTGGQGLNTGVQDAYNLGWKLEAALRNPGAEAQGLLDTYESERRAVAAKVLGLSSALLDRTVDGDPEAMDREGTHQLDISYRNLLPQDPDDAGEGVRAGDRAPDAPLTDAGGTPVRLFELMRGPQATLLVFGSEDGTGTGGAELAETAVPGERPARIVSIVRPEKAAAPGEFIDADGHARRAYGAADGTRILIRPDGYVGFLRR
ncbi:FAD-dependent monooxygenase [Nocardia sp. 2]|uniref:FAD-dependent monooxygenase n=1 Tax=Nocardia acididurans TaxID=2802282 RepID=A0ABS1M9U7_9NOCA|nr:FAD-dependent monooxygenase [Nocardia acididurans]MBL1076539.1 FAD-dependent monooxygenase [Nocardia acididurans]